MRLSILITTTNENIKRVKEELLPQLKNVYEVIISHQIYNDGIKPEIKNLGRNVKYYYMFDKGLSKNRNNALKHATGDICHICDDDLNYIKNFEKKIIDSYNNNNNADLIIFQAVDENGIIHGKFKNKFYHNKFSVLSVTSWMITFRRKKILHNKIFFDEIFGLGSKICVGEENIFLVDCIKKNLKVLNIPKKIVIHPKESSGLAWRDELIISRTVVFRRMFGFFGGLFSICYFTLFKYKSYKKKYSIFRFFRLSFRGTFIKYK